MSCQLCGVEADYRGGPGREHGSEAFSVLALQEG
jgi:hypothetical protein